MGCVINSSAQMVPHCLSFGFASSANFAYCMQFVTKLREKTFFKNLIRNPL